jgi:hypothetical protein
MPSMGVIAIYRQSTGSCLVSNVHGDYRMKRWALILGLAGALWMVFALYSKSLLLAVVSNYPGAFAARWVQFRGIAPSAETILAFNVWLVITSALEWIAVGLIVRLFLRLRLRSDQ